MIRETSRLVSIRVPSYTPESPALVWMVTAWAIVTLALVLWSL